MLLSPLFFNTGLFFDTSPSPGINVPFLSTIVLSPCTSTLFSSTITLFSSTSTVFSNIVTLFPGNGVLFPNFGLILSVVIPFSSIFPSAYTLPSANFALLLTLFIFFYILQSAFV